MYGYFTNNPLMAIIFIVLVVAVIIFLFVKLIQQIGLEKVRKYTYEKILEAEHEFKYGDNEQKFDYVVQLARSSIPLPFSLFITEGLMRKTVQLWFNLVKDFLDDKKLNGSSIEKESEV